MRSPWSEATPAPEHRCRGIGPGTCSLHYQPRNTAFATSASVASCPPMSEAHRIRFFARTASRFSRVGIAATATGADRGIGNRHTYEGQPVVETERTGAPSAQVATVVVWPQDPPGLAWWIYCGASERPSTVECRRHTTPGT